MTDEIDSVAFFKALADEMNGQPQLYEVLGDIELDVVLVMTGDPAFRVRLLFDGITCDDVVEVDADDTGEHCQIVATREVWQEMFDDIVANGRATGRLTLNALTMWGEDMQIVGDDPMDTDRVSRFNQTLQQFLDGAATVAAAGAST